MDTYSLLQVSLDQMIDRSSLEDASNSVHSLARADCVQLQRELFGIVVSGLKHEDALAFQAALQKWNFPTEVVADRELPKLHESLQIQRIDHRDEMLILTDSMGRVRTRPLTDLVFLAGGYTQQLEIKAINHQRLDFSEYGQHVPKLVTEREYREERELQFRIDFFFWTAPHRLHAVLTADSAIFHQGKLLRLRADAALNELMAAMAKLLPEQRLSSGLHAPAVGRFYPNFRCYEEEIRWHFHQLKRQGS